MTMSNTKTVTRYTATVNVPGYLPMADDVNVFETAREAWGFLLEEMERGELAWQPADPTDPDGPQDRSEAALEIERQIDARHRVGTVYGPSYIPEADEDTSTDLGLAYSVEVVELTEQELEEIERQY
jgi:hypothetical protein